MALVVAVVAGILGSIVGSFPSPQGALLKSGNLVGVDTGGAYAWLVPTGDNGVVIVDSGLDPEGTAIKAALHDRKVHAILLTHGHGDHVGGLAAFPDVPVYGGPGELPLIRGDVLPRGPLARVFAQLMPRPTPDNVSEVADGQVLQFDDQSFEVLHVPGHTAGSTVYLWGDVAFTGDSLLGHGDAVAPAHRAFADDFDQNLSSLRRLLERDFDRIADGHAGVHEGVPPQLRALLE